MRVTTLISAALAAQMACCAHAQQASDDWLDEILGEEAPPAPAETPGPAAEASAETVQEEQKAPPRAPQLEEIVVTAQKREESLQDTPISLATFNAEQLETAGIAGLNDLTGFVPSLAIEPFPTNNATLRFYIRGIGLIDAQITQDPAIGVYLDGVYIARSTGTAFDIADLERIEVLRGPQGTLYGRNTTGGAINLVTRRPSTDRFESDYKVSFGNRNHALARGSFNIPLSDVLAVKIAALGSMRDGFIENTGPGGDFGDKDTRGLRFDLRWTPAGWPIVDYAYDRTDIRYFNYLYQAELTPEGNKGQTEQIKREGQANSVYSARRLDELATGMPLEESDTKIEGHALTLTQPLGNHEIKYIGAYRELYDASYPDLGGGKGSTSYRLDSHRYDGPAAFAATGAPTPLVIPAITQSQWSHELQLTGSLFGGAVEYIAGLFHFTEEGLEDRTPLNHQFSSALSPDPTFPVTGPIFSAAGPRLVNLVSIRNEIENEALALYGQATWTPGILEERLHLTLGYRRSEDERKAVKFKLSENYVEAQVNGQGVGVPLQLDLPPPLDNNPALDPVLSNVALLATEQFIDVPAARDFSDDSYSFISEYDVNDNVGVYAKYVEAYKSGGFNLRDPQIDGNSGPASDGNDYGFGFTEGFDKELVASTELGIKTELLDRRLRVNGNIFRTDYTDMQINFLLAGTISDTKTANVGEAELSGFELDVTYLASRSLLLNASYASLDADILEVIDINGNNVADEFQFSSAPPESYTLSADWTFLERDWGNLSTTFSYNFVGERLGGAKAGQPVELDAYGLFNLRLGANDIRVGSGRLNFALWGKNITDEEYPINAIDNLPHADRAVLWGESRSFGLDLIYRR